MLYYQPILLLNLFYLLSSQSHKPPRTHQLGVIQNKDITQETGRLFHFH